MPEGKTVTRYTLVVLAIVLFPCSLVGGALQIRAFDAGGRQSPQEWVRDYQHEYAAAANCLVECDNGDLIIAGTNDISWSEYYKIMRVRADGSVVWVGPQPHSPYVQGVRFSDVLRLAADRYLIVGARAYWNGSTGFERVWLLCIDGAGGEVWNRSYNVAAYYNPCVGLACPGGGAVIITSTYSGTLSNDSIRYFTGAFRIDSDGAVLWNVTYTTSSSDEWVEDAAAASDGRILVVGRAVNHTTGEYHRCIVRCLEPTGTLRWNQTYDDKFQFVVCGDDYLMVEARGAYSAIRSAHVLCIDHEGDCRWSFDFPAPGYGQGYALAAGDDGYLIAGNLDAGTGNQRWDGLFALKVDNSGVIRWFWNLEGVHTIDSLRAVASGSGGFYLFADWSDALVRLPDPPALTTSVGLLAQFSYMLAILLAFAVSALMLLYTVFYAELHSSAPRVGPRELVLVSLVLQFGLVVLWVQQAVAYGPVRPYYGSYYSYEDASTVLLFLLLSPLGIANVVLGALSFAGLQVALFPLDRYRSLEHGSRGQSKGVSYLTCVCLAFAAFLAFYAIFWPAFYLAMIPFLNGVILIGFLPKYLLSRRWS